MQHICKICNQELKNAQSLSAHCRTKHKMTSEDVYIEYFLNGIPPICECGCGEKPNYLFKWGHLAKPDPMPSTVVPAPAFQIDFQGI